MACAGKALELVLAGMLEDDLRPLDQIPGRIMREGDDLALSFPTVFARVIDRPMSFRGVRRSTVVAATKRQRSLEEAMDWKLELIVVPVSDVDRAKAFYSERLGFNVDVDHRASDTFRVVQLTPPGSACSITVGTGLTQVAPGTYQGLHLVVDDIEVARAQLIERGVEVSEPFHFGAAGQQAGLHPDRADYGTFMSLSDPDGNGWLVQEVKHRAPGR